MVSSSYFSAKKKNVVDACADTRKRQANAHLHIVAFPKKRASKKSIQGAILLC
jgi:hypothetical protein